MANIALGSKVRDKITGFEGVATSRHFGMAGELQIGVQPPVAKDKLSEHPEGIVIDEATIEVIGAGESALATPVTETKIKLGEMVEDNVTGFRGIATTRSEFMNGCVFFSVQGKAVKKGDAPPKWQRFEHFRLKKVGAGISASLPKPVKAAAKAAPVKRPGGPSRRISDI